MLMEQAVTSKDVSWLPRRTFNHLATGGLGLPQPLGGKGLKG